MTYVCSRQKLLSVLSNRAKAKADAIAAKCLYSDRGLLSVGLKLFCLTDTKEFEPLIKSLGGYSHLEVNMYRPSSASWSMVLPPVGSAETAIELVECLEQYTGAKIFGNKQYQLQVCTPGQLNAANSALLGIGFYLASDTIRKYKMADLETTVSTVQYFRGRRLVLYDAGGNGEFDQSFEWWVRKKYGKVRIKRRLPVRKKRTDVIVGVASRDDIRNVNLIGSLLFFGQESRLCHYWHDVGREFKETLQQIVKDHQLESIAAVDWVVPTDLKEPPDDQAFRESLHDLVAFAMNEGARINSWNARIKLHRLFGASWATEKTGIFEILETVLADFRSRINSEGVQL